MDLLGNGVQAARMEGDRWRTRHEFIKMVLARLSSWVKVPYQCEVCNLFAPVGEQLLYRTVQL